MTAPVKSRSLLALVFGAIVLLGALHVAASTFYFYWSTGWFDNLMHFLGGFSLGLFSLWVLFRARVLSLQTLSVRSVVFASVVCTLCIGAGWEVFEYFIDPTHAHDVTIIRETYAIDTVKDLVSDTLGAFFAGFVGVRNEFHS